VWENRSGGSVVQSALGINRWLQQVPTVSEARPSRCPTCGAPSCPLGGGIQLQGHGTREREVRGPPEAVAGAALVVVVARRYRCVPCGAVLIVVPREVRGRRVYSASAIGLALALWGLLEATAAQVRQRVCPAKILGAAGVTSWATLRRWAGDVRRKRLFPSSPDAGPSASLRTVAARAASALAASADPTTRALPIEHRAFLGAAHVA
jgi:hypothetical protein